MLAKAIRKPYFILKKALQTLIRRDLTVSSSFFRRREDIIALVGKVAQPTESINDASLVKRIIKAYQMAKEQNLGQSMWQAFFNQYHQQIHQILEKGNIKEITYILRNPGKSELFYGMDNLTASIMHSITSSRKSIQEQAMTCLDNLIRFGEAIGAIPLYNHVAHPKHQWDAHLITKKIEEALNITLNFPNPYPDEIGAWTPRGIASYRPMQALYQAWLIRQLLPGVKHPRILEIGAGLGRTAYYTRLLGIEDYTIIDIPMTAVSSAYFLGRSLGEENILLLGEQRKDAQKRIKIFSPEQFLNSNESYDLIINADSLTEIDPNIAQAYINRIRTSTPIFLSINHEANSFSVKQLIDQCPNVKNMQRKLYWMRPGYVEEIIQFK